MFEKITELQWSYMAGIVDGEGCIYIGSHRKSESGRPYFVTTVQVAQANPVLTDWLKKTFGGELIQYTAKQTPKCARRNPWLWKLQGSNLKEFCEKILPYSVSKKRELEIMIEMRKTYERNWGKRTDHPGKTFSYIPDEVIQKRIDLMHELRSSRG